MKRESEKIMPIDTIEEKHEVAPEPEEKKENIDDKKETKKLLIILGIIALICIAFIVWIYISKNKPPVYETYQYKGFTFTKIEGLWQTEWQKGNNLYNVHVHYGPRESQDITIYNLGNTSFTINNSVYITFDPGQELGYIALASTELSLSLYNTFHLMPIAACTTNSTPPCYKRPIITCATTNESVIYIRKANETGVYINGRCMLIEGSGEDIVRAADKVIWVWYGIL